MSCSIDILDRVITVDEGTGVALHVQIRRALRTVIEQHFEDGQKFFTEAELGERIGASQGTLRRALLELSREGLLERRVAKGSFVRKRLVDMERAVGIFVPAFESSFWAGMLEEFSRVCRAKSLQMQVFHTHAGQQLASAYRSLGGNPQHMAAVLLGDAASAKELYQSLDAKGYRTIAVDVVVPGHRGPSVQVDNAAGIRAAVDHLVGLGHSRIALLSSEPSEEGSVVLRVETYKSEMVARGLEVQIFDCGTRHGENAFSRATEIMPQIWAARPTAVIAVSDAGAWAVLKWCAANGVQVPQQLSVVGFDDDRPSLYTFPALTSVAQPVRLIAEEAVRLLWAEPLSLDHVLLPPQLVVRESTGPVTSK